MAIYQTGAYQVHPSGIDKVKRAIVEFVEYVKDNEPGTQMYLAWQQKDDPTRFVHLFIFQDAAAQARHGESDAVKHFESIYTPELVGGDVVFTDYELVAGKLVGSGAEALPRSQPPRNAAQPDTEAESGTGPDALLLGQHGVDGPRRPSTVLLTTLPK